METINAAGGYGPPGSGGGWGPPGGGYGAPPTPPGGGYGSPPGSPPAGGFGGAPTGGYAPPAAPALPAIPDMGTDVNTTMPLLLNALALIVCGASVIGAPLAILGLVFAVQAKNAKGMGDVVTARSKAKQSMFFFAGTLLLGPVLFLVLWQYLSPASPKH